MLFNSIEFAVFLPIVFLFYWMLKASIKGQNTLLIIASYVFYGWWSWKFLSLILISSILDFYLGLAISKSNDSKKRKKYLWVSLIVNLGFLGFFKYFNFFVDSFSEAFTLFGSSLSGPALNIILPVGISFYTFQTLSYTIDVYNKKLKPSEDIIAFSAFVCFFPQLVAGPIERASNLLPQFLAKRKLNYQNLRFGLYLIVFGLFKKMIIGDNLSSTIKQGFSNPDLYNSSTLILVALLFSIQIYCDFSGYTDIARGTARMFGFKLMENFKFPYFASSIGKFWRHWHISLSTWFRDYVYIPLGGSRLGKFITNRNLLIVFITSGLWHGANWTYVIWGAIHGLFLVFENQFKKSSWFTASNNLIVFSRIIYVNIVVIFCWIFFRATSVELAWKFISNIFSSKNNVLGIMDILSINNTYVIITTSLAALLLLISDLYYNNNSFLSIYKNKRLPHVLFSLYVFFLIFAYQENKVSFIYFQF